MAFPGAFDRKEVRYFVNDKLVTFGIFADGGATNNFPIETFDQPAYVNGDFYREGVNPCTLGFSLVPTHSLDEKISPIPEIKSIVREYQKHKLKKLSKEDSKMKITKLYGIFKVIKDSVLGVSENLSIKYQKFKNQIVLLSTMDIETLEFNLSFEKKKNAIECGFLSTCSWYKEKRIELQYDPLIKVYSYFDELTVVRKSLSKSSDLKDQDIDEKTLYIEAFKKYFFIILNEIESLKIRNNFSTQLKIPKEALEKNNVIIYTSHLLIQLHQKLSDQDLLKECFEQVVTDMSEQKKMSIEYREKINHVSDRSLSKNDNFHPGVLFKHIVELASNEEHKIQERALVLLKGQLSHLLYLPLEDVIHASAKNGNVTTLKSIFSLIESTRKNILLFYYYIFYFIVFHPIFV